MKKGISLILALFMILNFFPMMSVHAENGELRVEESESLTEETSNVSEGGEVGAISNDGELSIDPKEAERRLNEAIRAREASTPLEAPVFPAALSGEERFTVLVLDVSGSSKFLYDDKPIYTADSATELVVESAETFVKNLYAQGNSDRLAIVTYDSNAKTILNFSNNSEEVLEHLRSIHRSSDETRSIHEGLKLANQLLRQVPKEVPKQNKNVVLISTGMTDAGEYSYQGHYDKSVIGGNWYRINTGVHLYAYANLALATADSVKRDANLYSLGLFQNFDKMPSEGLNVVELFRLTARDLASSPSHYVEVRDPKKLGLIFENTAGKILEPLKLKLTGKVTREGDQLQCIVRAVIRNKNKASKEDNGIIRNVAVTLELPEGAVLAEGQKVQNIGDVPVYKKSADERRLEWTFRFPIPEDRRIPFWVKAKGDNSEIISEEGLLYYIDNAIGFGKDQWNFFNDSFSFSPKNYFITDRDFNRLTYTLKKEDEKRLQYIWRWYKIRDKLKEKKGKEWGGSCYGMAYTVVLAKMREFQAGELQSGREFLYKITKEPEDNIESFINYYQLSQSLPNISDFRAMEYSRNFSGGTEEGNRKVLIELEKKTLQVKNGGAPVLVAFSGTKINTKDGKKTPYGHTIVAYKMEEGHFLKQDKEYNAQILIYDPNRPNGDEDSYIYYNRGTSEFLIPNYTNQKKNVKEIQYAVSDYRALNDPAYFRGSTPSYSKLYVDNLRELSLHTDNGKVDKITPLSKGENYFTMPLLKGDSSEMEVFFTDFNEGFRVEVPKESEDYRLAMNYPDRFLSAATSEGENISFDPSGTVSIDGQRGDFEVSVVTSSDKHTVVSGKDAGLVSMADTSDGVKITADSQLKEVTVAVDEMPAQTVNTNAKSILIQTSGEGTPVVMSDEDQNGTYETKIEMHSVKISAEDGGQVAKLEGQFSAGASVTVEAIPYDGYTFDRWEISEGSVNIGKEAKTTFVMSNESVSLVAHFKKLTDMANNEFFAIKSTGDEKYEWKIQFSDAPLEEFLNDDYFFVMNEAGYRVPEILPTLDKKTVKMTNAVYEKGKTYYLIIRRGVKSQNGKELKRDVIFKFYVK